MNLRIRKPYFFTELKRIHLQKLFRAHLIDFGKIANIRIKSLTTSRRIDFFYKVPRTCGRPKL